MKKIIAAGLLMALAGSATAGPGKAAARAEFEETIPTCTGAADCKAKWEAAQLWLVKNSKLKIKTVTDVIIETRGPKEHDPSLAIRITKEPQGGGTYRIVFFGDCDNMFGCLPNAYVAGAEFNRTVSAASP